MSNTSVLIEPHPDSYIWKYFDDSSDFKKLRTFLKGELFFSAVKKYNDYFEGITPELYFLIQASKHLEILKHKGAADKKGLEKISFSFQELPAFLQLGALTSKVKELFRNKEFNNDIVNAYWEKHEKIQSTNFVSCWFCSETTRESFAMWKNYSSINGVAIRMRYSTFKKQVIDNLNQTIDYGLINYVDYKNESDNWLEGIKNGIPPVFFKHSSFDNEKEFRIRIVSEGEEENIKSSFFNFGLVDNLDIILHPSSLLAHYKQIEKIVAEHNLRVNICFSELNYRPVNKEEAERLLINFIP